MREKKQHYLDLFIFGTVVCSIVVLWITMVPLSSPLFKPLLLLSLQFRACVFFFLLLSLVLFTFRSFQYDMANTAPMAHLLNSRLSYTFRFKVLPRPFHTQTLMPQFDYCHPIYIYMMHRAHICLHAHTIIIKIIEFWWILS